MGDDLIKSLSQGRGTQNLQGDSSTQSTGSLERKDYFQYAKAGLLQFMSDTLNFCGKASPYSEAFFRRKEKKKKGKSDPESEEIIRRGREEERHP
jgi:hypothetical protein